MNVGKKLLSAGGSIQTIALPAGALVRAAKLQPNLGVAVWYEYDPAVTQTESRTFQQVTTGGSLGFNAASPSYKAYVGTVAEMGDGIHVYEL